MGQSGERYESSVVSFLFSLKDHAGVRPMKMPIKSDKTASAAILQGSSYGPTFGNDCDLYVLCCLECKHKFFIILQC